MPSARLRTARHRDRREPIIDIDIDVVVVAAMVEEAYKGELHEVTGPRLMSFAEMSADLSRATGREIRHIPVSFEKFPAHIALLMLLAVWRSAVVPIGMAASMTVFIAFPVGRLVGLAVDGMPSGSVIGALVVELIIAAPCPGPPSRPLERC